MLTPNSFKALTNPIAVTESSYEGNNLEELADADERWRY